MPDGGSGGHGGSGGAGGAGGNGGQAGGGGGGLGAGGDIFVQTGGVLVIEGGTLSGGTASGGAGGSSGATSGQGFGAGIFIQGTNPTITLAPSAGETLDILDAIGDQTGSDPGNANYGLPGSAEVLMNGAGIVVVDAANTFDGGVSLDSGTLELDKVMAAGSGAITFGGAATLRIGAGLDIANIIYGFGTIAGSLLDFPGIAPGVNTTATLGSGNVLTVTDQVHTQTLTLDPTQILSQTTFPTVSDGGGGVEIVCYLAGTRIATPAGEAAVEELQIGDLVLTASGVEEPIKWIGRRRIYLSAHPRPETVAPVRIQRGAFADNLPYADLLLSPDHAILVDGKLICASQLINRTTIRQVTGWTSVDYYHVELERHAILLAEGLPAESYLDTGNRGFFGNSDEPLVLHPSLTDETDYPTRQAGSCAPFVSDEANVRPVWQRLADRAAAIGVPAPQRATTMDANLRLLADRRPVKPVFSDSERVIFVLPRGAREVWFVSRAQSPTEARPWLDDRRRLGVRVKRIVLRGADELREIPVDHPHLTRGWWAVERDGQVMSRWTDGEAVLPLPAMQGTVMLEIHLAGSMIYAVDAVPEDGVERCAAA